MELPPPSDPDPAGAAAVQELMGGRFGEMSTFLNYTFQSWNFRDRQGARPFYELVANIAAEELVRSANGKPARSSQPRCAAARRPQPSRCRGVRSRENRYAVRLLAALPDSLARSLCRPHDSHQHPHSAALDAP